jgi:hypothetical protein
MIGFNGGLIGGLANARNTSSTKSNPGVWTLDEQRKAIFSSPRLWPDSLSLPAIGAAYEGGFYAGLISHTDDSVATHALIVAPRATGASGTGYTLATNYQWKTSNTNTADASNVFDGAVNETAIVTAGLAAHPAANFCSGLTIGGYTDWYLPSRYELQIAYFNLKPSTASNSTSFGINPYSVPERTTNHTAGIPAQTTVAAFQAGGSEAFEAQGHWSSTIPAASSNPFVFYFGDGVPGQFIGANQTERCRAFRKVTI